MKKLLPIFFLFTSLTYGQSAYSSSWQQSLNKNTSESREENIQLIEDYVAPAFQETAKSLLKRNTLRSLKVIDGRLVFAIKTSDLYYYIQSSALKVEKEIALGPAVKFPFPNSTDTVAYEHGQIFTREYLTILAHYGYSQTATEIHDPNDFSLYGKKLKLGRGVKALTTIRLTNHGSIFDNAEIQPWLNLCDQQACVGSYGSKLEIRRK